MRFEGRVVRRWAAMGAVLGLVLPGCASSGDIGGARTGHGMLGADQTVPAGSASHRLRTYYIAADEVAWDFAPTGRHHITGQPFDAAAKVFVPLSRR